MEEYPLEPVGVAASEIHLGHLQTQAIAKRILALSSPCSSLLLLTDTNLTELGHAGALSRALVLALDQLKGTSIVDDDLYRKINSHNHTFPSSWGSFQNSKDQGSYRGFPLEESRNQRFVHTSFGWW